MMTAGGTIDFKSVLAWVEAAATAIATQKDYLTRLDSAIGDADHGINMNRGFQAALEKLAATPPADVSGAFKTVGMALVSKVGGAAGPLYGTFFLQLSSATVGKDQLTPAEWAEAFRVGVDGVKARGKAKLGDKTMIDALMPGLEALETAVAEGAELTEALRRSAEAAAEGMKATIPLVARKGRASYLGERSAGHQDPGATSSHLLLQVAASMCE